MGKSNKADGTTARARKMQTGREIWRGKVITWLLLFKELLLKFQYFVLRCKYDYDEKIGGKLNLSQLVRKRSPEKLRPKQIHPIVTISHFPWVGAEPVWNSLIEMPSGSNTAENQTMLSPIVKTILHYISLVPIAGEGLYEKWILWPNKKCS